MTPNVHVHNFHHYHYSSSVWSAQYIINYIPFVPVLLIKASFFSLYDMACDFKARIDRVFTHSFLVTLTESPALRKKKTEIYQANVGAKVEPHTPYTLNVFSTQM